MIQETDFYGGSSYQSFGSDLAMHFKMGKVVNLSATAGSLKVKLPPIPSDAICGSEYFVLINTGSNDVALTDSDGDALSPAVTIAVDEACTVVLALSGTTKVWKAIIEDITGISPPVFTTFVYIGGAAGGISDSKRIQGLDVFTYTWSQGTSSTQTHEEAGAFALANRGYVFGNSGSGSHEYTEEYVDDGWTAKTNATFHNTSTDISGKGYVTERGGGARVSEYDRVADSWTAKNSATSTYDVGVWAGCDGYGYGTYGFSGDTNTNKYDPSGDSWSTLTATAPTPARTNNESGDANSTHFYVACGYAGAEIDDVDEYDVSGDSWAGITDYPPGNRTKPSCVCANEKMYVSCGSGSGTPTYKTDSREYDPSTTSWSSNYATVYGAGPCSHAGFAIPP
jgi:hypothetical protein